MEYCHTNSLQTNVKMKQTAVDMAPALTSMPHGTRQGSASAMVDGLEITVLSVSGGLGIVSCPNE